MASVETVALGVSSGVVTDRATEQYVIGPFLNQGGMATVFQGRHIGRTGAELQSRLTHPCIVKTTDLVVLDGEYYLVMEYVRGGDLQLLLRRARGRVHAASVRRPRRSN